MARKNAGGNPMKYQEEREMAAKVEEVARELQRAMERDDACAIRQYLLSLEGWTGMLVRSLAPYRR